MSLTTGIDTITITGSGADTVVGLQQGDGTDPSTSQTWNSGDTISGNSKTNISLIANGSPASVVTASNIASVNVNLVATSNLNSSQFTNVAQVAVTNGFASQSLIVASANLATTYAINQARATTIDLASFSNTITGDADAVSLSVTGAGSKITAAGTFDLGGNAIEIVNLATSGTNYVALADAGTVTDINISGAGTNHVNVAGLFASTLTVVGGTGVDTIYATPAAGTSAATLSNIETVDVNFATAATFVSGVNWDGVTKVIVNAASDQAATFSNLQSSVVTADIKLVHANAENLSLGYATGSKGDLTLNVGTTTVDEYTVVGTTAITNLTGGLTINSKSSAQANEIGALTNTKATSFTVNSSAGLTFNGDVTLAKATDITLNSTAGTTLNLNTNQLVISSADSKDHVTNAIAISATGLDADDNGSVVSVEIQDATSDTYVNALETVTITSDADGSVTFDAIEINVSTLVIAGIDATASEGELSINLAGLAEGTTVTTGAGDATVVLTLGDDTFTAGAGAVYVTTTGGTDTIALAAAADTVELTLQDGETQVSSFTAGSSSKADTVAVDVSGWTDTLRNGAGDAVTAGTAADFSTITSAATAVTYATTDNVLVVTGIVADDTALVSFLSGLIWTTSLTDDEDFLAMYYDGESTQVVSLNYVFATTDVTVNADAATIVGVNTSDLVIGNIAFV